MRPNHCSLCQGEVRPHLFPAVVVHGRWHPLPSHGSHSLTPRPSGQAVCDLRQLKANDSRPLQKRDTLMSSCELMFCATCGCLAFTISKQSAQLPQKAASQTRALPPTPRPPSLSGNEAVSRICPRSPLRICNTSHKHWSTRLSWTLACSAVNSGGTVLNNWLALLRSPSRHHRPVLPQTEQQGH